MRRLLLWCSCVLVCVSAPRPGMAQDYAVDSLMAWSQSDRPLGLAVAPAGEAFVLGYGSVKVITRAGTSTFLAFPRSTTGRQFHPSAITLHSQYPDSPFVFLILPRTDDDPAMLLRYRDSAFVATHPDTVRLFAMDEQTGIIHANASGLVDVAVKTPQGSLIMRCGSRETAERRESIIAPDEILDFVPDTDSERFTILARTEGGNAELRSIAFNDINAPAIVATLSGFVQHPAFNCLVKYSANAFPRMTGKILLAGRRTPTVFVTDHLSRTDTLAPSRGLRSFITRGIGFPCIATDAQGYIYALNGSYYEGYLIRLRPVPPMFQSTPQHGGEQGQPYTYMPAISGTPPQLTLIAGPEGMTLDSVECALHWVPDNEQALQSTHDVILRAENGAGIADQEFSIKVVNVNDAPGPFALLSPPENAQILLSADPRVTFSWQRSIDPDRDTVNYTLDLDTVDTFTSNALRHMSAGTSDTLTVRIPARSGTYFWRVSASDGRLLTWSTPPHQTMKLTALAQESVPRARPKETALEQNFPNPFNPTTSIKYTLPEAGHVRLSVFNLLGQELAVVFDGLQNEGTHEVEFNNAALPSGIYFYRLQAPGIIQARKMVITK